MTKQLHFPLTNIGISGDESTHGYLAYDFYWYDDTEPSSGRDLGCNPPLYACGDGTVVRVRDGCPDYRVDSYGYGNYIVIRYDKGYNGYSGHHYSLFAHIQKGTFRVSEGDRVLQGQVVANMDNSGHSFGCHLHLEMYKGDSWDYWNRVDSLTVLYVTKDQWVDENTRLRPNHTFLYASESPIPTVSKDIAQNQAYVGIENLRVRKAAGLNGEQEGLADKGYYNVSDVVTAVDGYDWAHVGEYYIALGEGLSEYIPAKVRTTEKDEKKNQVYIPTENLRIRAEPSTSSEQVGWCEVGYYDVLELLKQEDYTWYRLSENAWCAGVDGVEYTEGIDADKKRIKELRELISRMSELAIQIEEFAKKSKEI